MDPLSEDFMRTDVDTQMTALTHEDISEQDLYVSDEVEDLQNSLREAVHDETVRPKMQCLMMDSSFSMVTVQGEDSGIEWETNASRCSTPWASEAGNPALEFSSPVAMRPATPGSLPAGRIIVVMDEQQISRRKKTKERASGQKSKVDRRRETLSEDGEEISGRPELVGVSLPNVKREGEGDEEEVADPLGEKEQQLFSLVSEGSEILNIVVPPKLATVDEEESKVMVDNLSYLEESPSIKSSRETNDKLFDLNDEEQEISTQALTASRPAGPNAMDPPGAPVARPPGRGAAGNGDYFEKFTLIDAQAPGSPAVIPQGQEGPEADAAEDILDAEEPVSPNQSNTGMTETVDKGSTAAISGEEITSEFLDDVFYGGMDDHPMKSCLSREEERGAGEGVAKFPLKESGSALFGSQEDILTPIFLPEGPHKIIDPILLEEPKAMAFLYADLYEEAIGSRQKEEDAESMTSEKSFHSRHSDREARGYLEKYVLKDETPVLDMEPADREPRQDEGMRMLCQESHDDVLPNPEKGEMPNPEEVTDFFFFRSSANSSPCDIEPFPPLQEESDAQPKAKEKDKTNTTGSKLAQPTKTTAEGNVENPTEPLDDTSYEFFSKEPDWGSSALHPRDQDFGRRASERPIAPPRRKATSSPKTSLDLTPLTPVDGIEDGEVAGGKEQREEEKETASPAETADEGDGDGEETRRASSDAAVTAEAPETEIVTDSSNETTKTTPAEGNDAETVTEERSETEAATKQTGGEDMKPSGSAETDKQGGSLTDSTRKGESQPAKGNGRCIIL